MHLLLVCSMYPTSVAENYLARTHSQPPLTVNIWPWLKVVRPEPVRF